MTQMHRPMPIGEISFGVVERAITIGDKRMLRGHELTRNQLAAMPAANRNALIENRLISVFPHGVTVRRQDDGSVTTVAPRQVPIAVEGGEMHVIAKGFGKWDVIQGTIVARGLTSKAEAEAVAGKGEPVVEAQVDQVVQATTKKKRRASPGKHLPPTPPGEPQENGPVDG